MLKNIDPKKGKSVSVERKEKSANSAQVEDLLVDYTKQEEAKEDAK